MCFVWPAQTFIQQTGEPEVVPGTIGLVYDDLDFDEVLARLRGATDGAMNAAGSDSSSGDSNSSNDGGIGSSLFEGTKFAWREEREDVPGEEDGTTTSTVVSVTCPYGEWVGVNPNNHLEAEAHTIVAM